MKYSYCYFTVLEFDKIRDQLNSFSNKRVNDLWEILVTNIIKTKAVIGTEGSNYCANLSVITDIRDKLLIVDSIHSSFTDGTYFLSNIDPTAQYDHINDTEEICDNNENEFESTPVNQLNDFYQLRNIVYSIEKLN